MIKLRNSRGFCFCCKFVYFTCMTLLIREKQWLLDEKYGGVESPEFFADLEKLNSGTPLAYLIGSIPFLGCHIDLSSKPLIPRPETEYWVNEIIKNYIPKNSEMNILDIFSGSGCIGVAVLKHTSSTAHFGELQKQNIKQIQKNLNLNGIEKNRYQIFQSDVFENIPESLYDLILANPPYISKDRVGTVDHSVLDHEDEKALFADDDGLFYVKKLISESGNYLAPQGKLVIEFDPWQKDLLQAYLEQEKVSSFEFMNDQYGKTRILIITKNT